MKKLFLVVGLFVLAILLVAVARAVLLKPTPIAAVAVTPVALDEDGAVKRFIGAIQIPTESTFQQAPDAVAMKRMRDYLLKGGFLMVDHFHGPDQWERFMAGMAQVLPDYTVEDLKDSDEIYHVLYSIDEKFQIPGEQYVNTGRTYERDDARVPIWRAIRDDHGRIIVAICANMHLGDAWEWANTPEYPEKFSGLAFRVVLNYITYSMTH